MFVPFLGTTTHLGGVVGSEGKTFEMTASGDGPRLNKVLKGQTIKGPLRAPWTLHSLVDIFGPQIGPSWIITGSMGVLVVVRGLKPLEALCPSIVDVLGKGDESGRRRGSVGGRHFEWRTG